MCGIFGYVGLKTDSGQMILEGLKLLEYRGYDSWGIAIKSQIPNPKSQIIVEKHIGKIGSAKVNFPESEIGIGHTRWATHGKVTDENSHPHLDCSSQIAVVHNGIIENFQELKSELEKKGHKFISETDTEIFPHLLEENLKSNNFEESFKSTFSKIKGLNAIVAFDANSDQIIAAKTGSPLVVGKNSDGFFISSDVSGIINQTDEVIFLEDNQMIVVDKNIKLLDLVHDKELPIKFTKLDWKFENTQKGNYEHFLLKEINEQPKVLENISLNSHSDVKKLADLISDAKGTFMLGCGTASYAALTGVYLFSKVAKKHVNFSIGSEFGYIEDYLNSKSLIIPISQSGETIDVVEPVGKAKMKGAKIAAITNVLGSTLYRQADFRFMLGAGVEKAVIATKSFTSMFSVLLLAAYSIAGRQKEGENQILDAAKSLKDLLEEKNIHQIKKVAKLVKNHKHVYILGRGLSYPAALEGALKLKETAYVHAEGFAGGELKHGVIALVEKGTPIFVLAPNDETYPEIISNAQEVKARGGFIIGIGPKENDVFDEFLKTADAGAATLIPQIVYLQLLAYYLALENGITDPDKPRNLAKSVTVK